MLLCEFIYIGNHFIIELLSTEGKDTHTRTPTWCVFTFSIQIGIPDQDSKLVNLKKITQRHQRRTCVTLHRHEPDLRIEP